MALEIRRSIGLLEKKYLKVLSDCSELGIMTGEVQLAIKKKRSDERRVNSKLAEPRTA